MLGEKKGVRMRTSFIRYRYYILLGLIFCLGLFLRTWHLDSIPVGITNDELMGAYSGFSLLKTGQSLDGTPLPQALFIPAPTFQNAEFYPLYSMIFVPVFGISTWSIRLAFAVVGSASVLLIYLIFKQLFASRTVGLFGALFLAVAPWHIFISRSAYEPAFVIFFVLLGWFWFLNARTYKIVFAAFAFLLAFFSYHGVKFAMPVFVLSLIGWRWRELEMRKYLIYFCIVFFGIIIIYTPFFFTYNTSRARSTELLNLYSPAVTQEVLRLRSASVATPLWENFFTNKLSVLTTRYFNNLMGFFAVNLLFISGEQIGGLSLWEHGLFYPIEFIFLCSGSAFLFFYYRKVFYLFVALVGAGLLPSVLSGVGQTYIVRSALALTCLSMISGIGAYAIYRWKHFMAVVLGIYMIFFVVKFMFIYLYHYPVTGMMGNNFSDRLLAAYSKNIGGLVVVTPEPEKHLLQYAFYNHIDPALVQQALLNKSLTVGAVSFTGTCPSEGGDMTVVIHRDRRGCIEKWGETGALHDVANTWYVFKDLKCSGISSASANYLLPRELKTFAQVEETGIDELCKDWFYY
jgi:4-amino-4-deoxy-L-arabinose transferase-like glycosyltransferase